MTPFKRDEEKPKKYEGEITYTIKIKMQGTKPDLGKLKEMIENGLFDEYSEIYRVTGIFDDQELDQIQEDD